MDNKRLKYGSGSNKLTQRIAREYLSILDCKLRRNAQYDEYVLVFGEGDKQQTYFTSDLTDIIGTARLMQGGHPRFDDAEQVLVDNKVVV